MDVKIVVETKSHMVRLVEQLRASTAQEDRQEGRRKNWRLVFATPGSLEVDGEAKSSEPIYITTRDISSGGLGFLCRRPLEIGRKLVLYIETDNGEVEVAGTVRHCTATVGMYKIGVEFDLVDPGNN
jgi:c-di-GMP-binding flagellar brake protein YcgR